MQLKRNSPSGVIEVLRTLESRVDSSFDNLGIYSFPQGLACWAVLVSLVLATERAREERGYKNYNVNLINLSRRGALALRWIQEKGKDAGSPPQMYTFTGSLTRAVDQALSVAANYLICLDCFPMWHQDRQLAELLSESALRFMVPGGIPARRVSAFQKGFRVASKLAQDPGLVLSAEQSRQRDVAFSRCFYSGYSAIVYPEPTELYRSLLPSYLDRVNAMFRRADSVNLGPFNLGELKRCFAALSTIFSAHEDFCYRFGLRHAYPVNSCVMTRTRDEWAKLVARIVDLEEEKSSAIIDDLTLRDRFWDLHVQPFVPVRENTLGVAPQFPLFSRADENILRVCGHRRRSCFDEASRLKEQEMVDNLLPWCPKCFSPSVRVALPNRLPDIDLLLVDEKSSAVMVAELKWLRKPFGWKERVDREEDFKKGLRQLLDIRTFLTQNPDFLSARRKLKSQLSQYGKVAYVFIARDYFLWPEADDFIVADYEIFKEAVGQTPDLAEFIDKLRAYEWLPVEGKDFRVAFEPVGLNGVTIESEIFYRI